MPYAAANIVDFVRGFDQRKEAAKIKNEMKNYLADPQAAIQAVNQINPFPAIELQQEQEQKKLAADALARKTGDEDSAKYLKAVGNMGQMLRRTRDSGGDIGAAFDGLTPVLKEGFQMGDDEIIEWKAKITANPKLIDSLISDAQKELVTVSAGAVLADPITGEIKTRNPVAPKVLSVPRGDGGRDVITIDPETGAVNGGGGGMGPVGKMDINPTARGVRNNNQGNLKDGPFARKQPGYAGSDGTFAKFTTPEAGNAAQENLLRGAYFGQGLNTVNAIVDKYLGKGDGENSQASRANYKRYVAARLGVDPSAPISAAQVGIMAQAMREFENGTGSAASSGGPAYSTPGKPSAGATIVPQEESIALGLPAGTVYQRDKNGKISPVGGQAKAKNIGKGAEDPQKAALQADATLSSFRKLKSDAQSILNDKAFNQATGSIQGRLPSIMQGTVEFDKKVSAFRDQVVLTTLAELKKMSATGASGFGNLTEKEGARLENSKGTLDQASPTALRNTLRSIVKDSSVVMGYIATDGVAPPDAIRMLVNNPKLRADFDKKYGAGMAKKVLGK